NNIPKNAHNRWQRISDALPSSPAYKAHVASLSLPDLGKLLKRVLQSQYPDHEELPREMKSRAAKDTESSTLSSSLKDFGIFLEPTLLSKEYCSWRIISRI